MNDISPPGYAQFVAGNSGADSVPFPERLARLWDARRPDLRDRLAGRPKWENAEGATFLQQTERQVRLLRKAKGWTCDDAVALARHFPDGLGSLGDEAENVIRRTWAEEDAKGKAAQASSPGLAFGPFQILDTAALMNLPERGYLLKGIMSPGELSVWWGPPKCGKSFLLLHVAYALAQGRSVFGRRVRKCRVLYIACEGRTGLRARVEALVRRYGHAPDFITIAQPVDLGPVGEHVKAMREAIEHFAPDLVVVDTLNRVIAGGDENSSADMGALRVHFDELRQPITDTKDGPHLAVIHHGTKVGDSMRGHSSLLGAVDAGIEVAADEGGNRTIKLDAMKDDAGGALAFRLEVETLGPDADGDPRTTCLIEELGAAEPKKKRGRALSETQAGWLRDLNDMFAEPEKAVERVPVEGMKPALTLTRDEVRQGYRVRGRFTTEPNLPLTNADKVRLSSMLGTLKDKGKIGMTADLVWLL